MPDGESRVPGVGQRIETRFAQWVGSGVDAVEKVFKEQTPFGRTASADQGSDAESPDADGRGPQKIMQWMVSAVDAILGDIPDIDEEASGGEQAMTSDGGQIQPQQTALTDPAALETGVGTTHDSAPAQDPGTASSHCSNTEYLADFEVVSAPSDADEDDFEDRKAGACGAAAPPSLPGSGEGSLGCGQATQAEGQPHMHYTIAWVAGGGNMAQLAAADAAAACAAAEDEVPHVLRQTMREISRQLVPLPSAVDLDEVDDHLGVEKHPLGDVLAMCTASIDECAAKVTRLNACQVATAISRIIHASIGTVAAAAARDASQFIVRVGRGVPFAALNIRGLSFIAGDGVIPATRALSQLRSHHRQAVLYLGRYSLKALQALERSAIMLSDTPSDHLLQVREVVGASSKLLPLDVAAALEALEACYTCAVAPLTKRLTSPGSKEGQPGN